MLAYDIYFSISSMLEWIFIFFSFRVSQWGDELVCALIWAGPFEQDKIVNFALQRIQTDFILNHDKLLENRIPYSSGRHLDLGGMSCTSSVAKW